MGIKTKSHDRTSILRNVYISGLTFSLPADMDDYFVTSKTITALAVGTALTLVASREYVPGCSIFFDQTEQSGTDLVMAYEVVGVNQFGDVVKETVDVTASNNVQTLNAYTKLTSITPTTITNAAGSDSIKVGLVKNGERIKLGLPFRATGSGVIVRITLDSTGVAVPLHASEHSNYHTATLNYGAGAAGTFRFFLDPDFLAEI